MVQNKYNCIICDLDVFIGAEGGNYYENSWFYGKVAWFNKDSLENSASGDWEECLSCIEMQIKNILE